jgi:DNA polymerase III sliding clamp (beta) subunit (PCNA family)
MINLLVTTNNKTIQIDRKVFVEAISKAYKLVAKKSPLIVLTSFFLNVKTNSMTIISSDGDNLTHQILDCNSQIECKLLVNAQSFYEVIKRSTDDIIQMQVNGTSLDILDKDGRFSIYISNEEHYFDQEDEYKDVLEISVDSLNKLIKAVNITIDNRGSYRLEINEESVSMVVDTSNRISFASLPIKGTERAKIPVNHRLFAELTKLFVGNIKIALGTNLVKFYVDKFYIISRLYNTNSRDYRNYINGLENFYRFEINTALFQQCLARVLSFTTTPIIHLSFSQDSLRIASHGASTGRGWLIAKGVGGTEAVTLALNGNYLMESLSCSTNKDTTIFYRDRMTRVIFDIGATHIIMPMGPAVT